MTATSIDTKKQQLREQARMTRSNITQSISTTEDKAFRKNIHQLLDSISNWSVISGYLAIGDEIDPEPILEEVLGFEKTSVLPVVIANKQPLIFRSWRPGQALERGPLNTRHPLVEAEQIDPDVLLVPLLAFDRRGFRLGWGGGFYDRTIAELVAQGRSITTIGIAYSGQEIDFVPQDAYDQRVDYVVTERGVISTKQNLGTGR